MTQDSTQNSQDQADYDAAATSLAGLVRLFIYKHGTKYGHAAVDALAALCDSGDQARNYYRAALDKLPIHVAAAFRSGLYMPVLSVSDPEYPTETERKVDAAKLAGSAMNFCKLSGADEKSIETFMAYILEGADAGARVDNGKERPAPETMNVLAVARAMRRCGENRPAWRLFELAETTGIDDPPGDHFWFSPKMDDELNLQRANGKKIFYHYAMIDGKVFRYTVMSSVNDASDYKWNDLRYLGQGNFYCNSETPLNLQEVNAQISSPASS
jgi:hypothetical protein